jgi:hypothetical protein
VVQKGEVPTDYQAVVVRKASLVPDLVELKDVRIAAKTYLADEADTGYVYEMSKGEHRC